MESANKKLKTEEKCVEDTVIKTEVEDVDDKKIEEEPITNANDESLKFEGDQTMEVDKDIKDEKKDEIIKSEIKIEMQPDDPGTVKLSIDNVDDDDDEGDEEIMTPEDVRTYLQTKICDLIKDSKINPTLELKKRSLELQHEMREKNDEFNKLIKLFDMIYPNQEKFLRHLGVLPKIPTNTIAVFVDLPILPSALPLPKVQNGPLKPESNPVLKNDWKDRKELSITKVPMTAPPKPTPAPVTAATKSSANVDKGSKAVPECIDLTDDVEPTPPPASTTTNLSKVANISLIKHPAPLPPKPFSAPDKSMANVPPKPRLKIDSEDRGIVLQWDMPPNTPALGVYANLATFDIFGYQEQKNVPINTLLWKKIGSVKAMHLPMACTLTQFVEGNTYHFSIRAVDIYNRVGSYSDPISVLYTPKKKTT